MADFVYAQDGSWNDGATWGNTSPGVEGVDWPGLGDTISSLAGNVDITHAAALGTTPATSSTDYDLTIAAAGKLTLKTGGSLDMRGHVLCTTKPVGSIGQPHIEFETGSSWEFYDGYKVRVGTSLWNYGTIYGRGAFTISTRSGASSGGFFERNPSGQGVWTDFDGGSLATPFHLVRLGGTSDATGAFQIGGGPGGVNIKWMFKNGYAEDCGLFIRSTGNTGGAQDLQLVNFAVIGGTHTHDVHFSNGTAMTTGTALVENCRFDKGFDGNQNVANITFDNVFLNGKGFAGAGIPAEVTDVSLATSQANVLYNLVCPTVTRPTVIVKSDVTNTKAFAVLDPVTVNDATVVPLGANSTDGEYVTTNQLANGETATFNRPVFGPHKDGSGMRWVEFLTENTSHVYIHHGTGAGYTATMGVGHTGHSTTTADRGRILSSIVAIFDNRANCDVAGFISNDVADCLNGTGFTHNAKTTLWGSGTFRTGRYPANSWPVGYNYNDSSPSDAPGANDITDNPWPTWSSMADLPSLAKFAASLGITGTDEEKETAALRAFLVDGLSFHADYVAGCTHTAFATYYRNAFAPTNAAFDGTAHDGGDIGAVDYAPAATGQGQTLPRKCSLNLGLAI